MTALEIAHDRAERVRKAREQLPVSTALLDDLRSTFPDATLKFAREGTAQFRQPGDEGVPASDSSPSILKRGERPSKPARQPEPEQGRIV